MKKLIWVALLVIIAQFQSSEGQGVVGYGRGCEDRSCYPATGNLLIGRKDRLNATSTCGTGEEGNKIPARYCILSHLDPGANRRTGGHTDSCFNCDSTPAGKRDRPKESHRIDNIVYRWEPEGETDRAKQYRTWWQTEIGVNNATIELDLEAEFHVTHLIITFKSPRPAAMYIEKSYDWGKTWKIHRYFAADCLDSFPNVRKGTPTHLSEVVCQERYSRIVPSTFGSVIYRVLPPNININSPGFNPYSKEVQDLLKTTNLRIHMTQLHTLGDENLMENTRRDIKEKYFYAIYDMTVRGSCSCYGHADSCLPFVPEHENIPGMVHGKCQCKHNTHGNNCELCLPGYNDVPWLPGSRDKKNECKKCNCHDHSDSCYFNPSIFVYSGNVTGGVCENCTHNTEGVKCESCIEGFYQDPAVVDANGELDLNSPDICKQCDCDPYGTTDGGVCDSYSDPEEDPPLVAGQCHCKKFVEVPRCDKCINGYWNFSEENPDGCIACECNIAGISMMDGCDQTYGNCTCKRNVIGQNCDQCRPQHYGLSENDPLGCQPCDCDIGGSADNDCDVLTGQCKCLQEIGGRQCDEVNDFHFTGSLDYLLFEGELANGSYMPPTKIIKRMPKANPKDNTWTGLGFMQVLEGSTLTFEIPAIFQDMDYDLVIRHEHDPNFPNTWETAHWELIPDGTPNPEKCNYTLDEQNSFSMEAGTTHTEIAEPLCLEEGQSYKLKFTFDQYEANPNDQANILIDSITILPRTEDLEIFMADDTNPDDDRGVTALQMYEDNNCREYFIEGKRPENISDPCNDILQSVSMHAFKGGLNKECDCDPTGSTSQLCDKYTGQCPCKKNVYGRQCNRCYPGFYGFGQTGCLTCNCDRDGSLNPFCRQSDGQCDCIDGAYGRRCNECQPGKWNFPTCDVCECNGHATTCDAETGACIDCGEFTTGDHCEICLDGYYGKPTLEENIQCRACPCPGSILSGHSFADRCILDTNTNEPICECKDMYTGNRCDECDNNFFGNPKMVGGSCGPCNCSGNTIESEQGNCDPLSGICLKCTFNTVGEHCEYCQPGYHGNAVAGSCEECVCDAIGTNRTFLVEDPLFECDRITGECPCLPNVEGDDCSRCIANHWKIASGKGCEHCECDPVGSTSEQCNVFDGQCDCKEGFGGRQCDKCEANHWGNPRVLDGCSPCSCNPEGSKSFQCDSETGKCICREGIGGEKCDQCARGHVQDIAISPDHPVKNKTIPYGETPNCVRCGECFDNWDRILKDLKKQTEEGVENAERVKITGADPNDMFHGMENQLEEIKSILSGASIKNEELEEVQRVINDITEALQGTTTELDNLDNSLANTKQSIQQARSTLEFLKNDADRRKEDAMNMTEAITALQETNVKGALKLTQEAKRKSEEAKQRVDEVEMPNGLLAQSDERRKSTQQLMESSRDEYTTAQQENKQQLNNIINQITNLEGKIPTLNEQVCDGTTSEAEPCDSLCGGAGCGKCGGISCLNGALSKAGEAVKSARDADNILKEKDRDAQHVLTEIKQVNEKANQAAREAQEAHDLAFQAMNTSVMAQEQSSGLASKIEGFTSSDNSLQDVQTMAQECLDAKLDLDQAEIQNLATEINAAIGDVSEVEQIITETADNLAVAQDLKSRAEDAEMQAKAELAKAEKVAEDLSQAEESQNAADDAVTQTKQDIDSARSDLGQIEADMEIAINEADILVSGITTLANRQMMLQTEYTKNEKRVLSATDAALKAKTKADKANTELYQLNNGFKNVSGTLEVKSGTIGGAKNLALDLQERANRLSNQASNKLEYLTEVESQFEENERNLEKLQKELVSLACEMIIHLQVIESKSNFYRVCNPPTTWTAEETCRCEEGNMEPTCEPVTNRRDVSSELLYDY